MNSSPRPPTVVAPYTIAAISGVVTAGDVLVLDAAIPSGFRASDREIDRAVAGCALETPERVDLRNGQLAIATTGVALCRVDARTQSIVGGDLLTTSATPGHAMRAENSAEGAILGKAMESLPDGTGVIPVLVTLR